MPPLKGTAISDYKLDIAPKIGAISDWTDPEGTLRPDVPPQNEIGNKAFFMPLECPYFKHQDTLPKGVDKSDPFGLFSTFFTPVILESIIENTNKNAPLPTSERGPYSYPWTPLTIPEFYTFLGALIYMGLHYEFDIKTYWKSDPYTPLHTPISSRISYHRFDAISRALCLIDSESKAKRTAFEKVS
jgi:hypothetical protein